MQRILGWIAAAALCGCQAAPDGTVAFINVNVLPMDSERVLPSQTVLVQDGQIVSVQPTDEGGTPRAATVIDGTGQFLMPGITEMHGHLPGPDTPPEEVDRILYLFLSNGVTTVRGMLGNPFHIELRDAIENGERLGPTLYAAGPAFRGSEDLSPDAARSKVRDLHVAGFDLLKILEGLEVETYDAIADEANAVGIPFGGHVPNDVGLIRALAAGQGTVDHMDGFVESLEADESPMRNAEASVRSREMALHLDEGKIPSVVDATREAGAGVVPTLALWETFNADVPVEHYESVDGLQYMPQQTVDAWMESQRNRRERLNPEAGARIIEIRKKVLAALRDAGVPIIFGTDAPQIFNVPGFSIHREMAIMASAGMTPYEILESATRAAAEHFGSDAFGQVAAGRRADLILLSGSPLDDIGNLVRRQGVMVRGRWIPESEIQARLAEFAAPN